MAEGLPALLTVEEAGAVLRIGRTKAYALAKEWRATGGRSGLPVVDLGHVLRVPRHALEALIGGELVTDDGGSRSTRTNGDGAPGDDRGRGARDRSRRRSPSRNGRLSGSNQPDLFGSSSR